MIERFAILSGRALRIALVAGFVLLVTACAKSAPIDQYNYLRVTVAGAQTLGISQKDKLIRGVVVYFRNIGSDEFVLTADTQHLALTTSLTEAGFAVITAGFGKDRFGDPALVRSYLDLGSAASSYYGSDSLYLLAEGMGAIPALTVLASVSGSVSVRGMAAINPVLDLDSVGPQNEYAVARTAAKSNPTANPMRLPPQSFGKQKIALFVDPSNSLAATQAKEFNDRFGAGANISISSCSGSTGTASCFRGDPIVSFFVKSEAREHS